MKRAAALCFLLVAAACSRPESYTVGLIIDQTAETSAIGRAVKFGAEYQARLINDLDIRLVTIDDGNDSAKARQAAFKLVALREGIAAIGSASSGTTGAAEDVLGRFRFPLVMPVATSTAITEIAYQNGWNNLLRLVPTNDLQANAVTDFLLKYLSCTNPYLIVDQSEYARDLAKTIAVSFRSEDIEVLRRPLGSTDDLDPHLQNIKTFQSSCVVFAGYYTDASRVVKHLRAAQVSLPIVLTDGAFQHELFAELGPDLANIYVAFVATDWSRVPAARDLIAAYQAEVPGAEATAASFAPFGADAVALIAKLIRAAPSTVTRASLLAPVRDSDGFQFDGIAGRYEFDPQGNSVSGRFQIYKVEAGPTRFACITCVSSSGVEPIAR